MTSARLRHMYFGELRCQSILLRAARRVAPAGA
jgi:hypothetical protein